MDTVTSISLLEALRDLDNQQAWERFGQRYRPMVLAFAAQLGLQESDAQDAAQDTLLAFVTAYRAGTYSRDRGRLRSWLFAIAYHKVKDLQRRAGRERVLSERSDATGLLESIESPATAESVWDQEWERSVLRACLAEVAGHFDAITRQTFEQYVLLNRPAEKVASELGITRNAVYLGKNRVLRRLRQLRRQMEETW